MAARQDSDPREDFAVLFFSGLAVSGQALVTDAAAFAEAHDRTGRHVIDAERAFVGCYTAVLRSLGRTLVVNDLFGLSPIFYYQDDKHLIVSNRTHLISHMMLRLRIRRAPNLEVICTSLASAHRIFMFPYSHDTFLAGLRILPVDRILVLSDQGGVVEAKKGDFPALANIGKSSPSLYRDLIARAAQEITRNVTAAISSDAFSYRILDISGGKDSRLVFGAVASAGLLSQCFSRTTKNEHDGDLETGVAIAKLFDSSFDRGDGYARFSKRSEFALGFWRSIKAGIHHEVGMSNWPGMWQGPRAVRLNGGCGEVYRDLWASEGLLSEIHNRETFEELCRPDLPRGDGDVAFQSLWAAMDSMPGDTLVDRMCNHCFFFSDRFHFGLPLYNEWYGYVPFSPLQSAALLAASRMLDPNDRARGRAIFDVTELVMPRLNRLPFHDGSTWPAEFFENAGSGCSRDIEMLPFSSELEREHDEAEAHRKRSLDRNSTKIDKLVDADSIDAVLKAQAIIALANLREADASLARYLNNDFTRWFLYLWQEDPRRAATAASKILGVYDLCFDDETRYLDVAHLPLHENYSSEEPRPLSIIDFDRRSFPVGAPRPPAGS
jgi:hypothetical protein